MNKLSERKLFFKIFILGMILIFIQTMFQNNSEFLNILKTLKYYGKPFIYGVFL